MKSRPQDIGSLLAIRTADPQLLYVDKTAYLHRMIMCRGDGKSEMVNHIKELV